VLAGGGPSLADEVHRLQGLCCNTEGQINQALTEMAASASPRRPAALVNRDAVVCSYVAHTGYLTARPLALGHAAMPLAKYRRALVGVVVGGTRRPVTPEVELHFLTPQQIVGAAIGGRT